MTVIETEVPALIVPIAHGETPPAHGAVADTNVRPAGVGSDSETPVAFDGPLFVIVMMNDPDVPAAIVPGPTFVTLRFALVALGVTTVEMLFVDDGSGVVELTVAVLVIPAPAKPAGI